MPYPHDQSSRETDLSPLPLINAHGQSPLAATYTDKDRSLSVVYPPPPALPVEIVQNASHHRPVTWEARLNALTAAVVIFVVGVSLATVLTGLGLFAEALNQPKVIHVE